MNRLVPFDIEAYAETHSMPESSVCHALREETHRIMEHSQMLVGPLEGAFLKMTTLLVGAKQVLEIGMFTGYSALCFAEALPDNGIVFYTALLTTRIPSRIVTSTAVTQGSAETVRLSS